MGLLKVVTVYKFACLCEIVLAISMVYFNIVRKTVQLQDPARGLLRDITISMFASKSATSFVPAIVSLFSIHRNKHSLIVQPIRWPAGETRDSNHTPNRQST